MNLRLFSRNSTNPQNRDRVLEIDGEELPVKVSHHPNSKRITLRLMPGNGGLKVTMPAHVSNGELDAFLNRNRNWVAARLARLPKSTELDEGAAVPYRGIDHRIVRLDKLRGLVEASELDDEPVLYVPAASGNKGQIARKVHEFFKKQARAELDKAVAFHSKALGVQARQIRITDTTSRWGSCSTTRTLSFSWRVIMAPPEVLDYLAAHEVAHLREMNHSPRFWALVKQTCPDMEIHKNWLRKNGNHLHAVSFE